ncbi:hypothetical protein N9C00_02275 [Flavobacteriales bacterium]|nr:hypothetical protein [Flavobacteriales bacterium]
MRYLYTLLFAALSFSAFSQNNAIHVYPWNPDANHNNNIGADDLLPFLSVFGNEFGLPPEPCTYDGTDFEDLMFGVADGTIILDSIFIEYELEDITTYYPIGCPDQVTDTLVFNNSAMLTYFNEASDYWRIYGDDNYGYTASYKLIVNTQEGEYKVSLNNLSIQYLGFLLDGFFGTNANSYTDNYSIPLPEDWYLDEEGIHIESGWDFDDWPYYANYMHILPYWHYADE